MASVKTIITLLLKVTNAHLLLEYMIYIYYLIKFKKDNNTEIQALIDFSNKFNVITLVYAKK